MSVLQKVISRQYKEAPSGDFSEEVLGCGHIIQTCDKPSPVRECFSCRVVVNINFSTKINDPFHCGYQDGLSGKTMAEVCANLENGKYDEGYSLGIRHKQNGKRLRGYK